MTPECYVVGGAPRDVLLDRPVKDIDYVWIGATADFLLAKGFKPVAKEFPVFLDQAGNEHALARKEQKSGNGYKGFTVTFDPHVSLYEDTLRRDFTINQLAVAVDNWDMFVQTKCPSLVIDNHNGINDLLNRTLRAVSPETFQEDPVRVLRSFRFLARLDFHIDDETQQAIRRCIQSGEMNYLTAERIWKEMYKALNEPDVRIDLFLTQLFKFQVDTYFHPFLRLTLDTLFVFKRTEEIEQLSPEQQFALMFGWMVPVLSMAEFQQQKIPNSYARMAINMSIVINCIRWPQLTNVQILNALTQINAYSNPSYFTQLIPIINLLINTDYQQHSIINWDRFVHGFEASSKISFNDVNDSTLTGKQIGDVINQLRLAEIT